MATPPSSTPRLVTIYLLGYYRGLGLVAVSSLLLAALLAYLSVVLLSKNQDFTMSLSDTVLFLAAALLYHFAVSDVQGFAYTLGLTTLIDVLVVFLFTKPTVTLLAGTRFYGGGHRWSGLDPARLGAKTPWRSSAR
jgi:preprotein translocase subunit SecD